MCYLTVTDDFWTKTGMLRQGKIMPEEILKSKKCFKLVCGAGNENTEEVENLVYLYSKAGGNIFDVSANIDVVRAAKRGLERAGITKDRFICVSVGIKGDPHVNKASINHEKCRRCLKCFSVCPQNAIKNCIVNKSKCIGCGKCLNVCAYGAIEINNEPTDLSSVLPEIINEGIDCIEFHAITEDDAEVKQKWELINKLFSGVLSICIDRKKLSDEKFTERIKKMLEIRAGKTTIVQADGAPMSGGIDDYNSTLQAVAAADIVKKANLPVYVIISGGTNSKSKKLANLCGVDINGVAIGSYARKIVKDYLCDKMGTDEALKIATELVKSC